MDQEKRILAINKLVRGYVLGHKFNKKGELLKDREWNTEWPEYDFTKEDLVKAIKEIRIHYQIERGDK